MTFWTIQTLNGLSFGMLLFLLAAGLSLIFGLMRILNLAHGSYYVLGAYVALSVVQATGSLLLATIAGIAAVTVLGILMERLLLRRLPTEELPQALLTFGLLLIIGDLSAAPRRRCRARKRCRGRFGLAPSYSRRTGSS